MSDPADEQAPATRIRTSRVWTRVGVAAISVASALMALFSHAHPTGNHVTDAIFTAVFAGTLTWAASRARRWTWLVFAGTAAAMSSSGPAQLAAGGALVAAAASVYAPRRWRVLGAIIGAVAVNTLVRGSVLPLGLAIAAGAAASLVVGYSAYRLASHRIRRSVRRLVLSLGLAVVALTLAWSVQVSQARSHADRGIKLLRTGVSAARAGDQAKATTALNRAADALGAAHDDVGAAWALPAVGLPGIGPNAAAVRQLVQTASGLATSAQSAVTGADLEQLTLKASALDLAQVHRAKPGLEKLTASLTTAVVSLDHLRSPWLIPAVSDRVHSARVIVADATPPALLAIRAVDVAPSLLGETRTQRYFVAFTTPVEARGRTGFPGNYAEIEVTNGHIKMTKFGRHEDLETNGLPLTQRKIAGPAEYISRYGRFEPEQTWVNVTLSPDFPTVAQVIAQLYPQSGGDKIDGVISIDPEGIAALLKLTGPVQVPGLKAPVTAQTAAGLLYRQQYVEFTKVSDRIDILQTLAQTTFERLSTKGLPGLRTLLSTMIPVTSTGHIQFASFDPPGAALMHRLGVDGAMPPVDSDSLGIVSSNATGNKIDQFLDRSVRYDVKWDPKAGKIEGTTTITLHNSSPSSGLPDYIIGNAIKPVPGVPPLPKGTNRLWLSIYMPWIPVNSTVDGKPTSLQVERELGRYVGSTFIDVAPGGTRTVKLSWTGVVDPNSYQLSLVAQPFVHPDRVSVTVNITGGGRVRASRGVTLRGRVATQNVVLDRNRALALEILP